MRILKLLSLIVLGACQVNVGAPTVEMPGASSAKSESGFANVIPRLTFLEARGSQCGAVPFMDLTFEGGHFLDPSGAIVSANKLTPWNVGTETSRYGDDIRGDFYKMTVTWKDGVPVEMTLKPTFYVSTQAYQQDCLYVWTQN